MNMKIYGHPGSQPTRAVLWALNMTRTPHEFIFVDPGSTKANGSKSPVYAAMFPAMTVPALEIGDLRIVESNAILTYLADKFEWTDLYPKNLEIRARIHELLHWHHLNTRMISLRMAPFINIYIGLIPKEYQERQMKVIKRSLTELEHRLMHSYFLGEKVTLADLAIYEEVAQCQDSWFGIVDLLPYPRIRAWLNKMELLPAHKKTHRIIPKLRKFYLKRKSKMIKSML